MTGKAECLGLEYCPRLRGSKLSLVSLQNRRKAPANQRVKAGRPVPRKRKAAPRPAMSGRRTIFSTMSAATASDSEAEVAQGNRHRPAKAFKHAAGPHHVEPSVAHNLFGRASLFDPYDQQSD